MNTLSRKRKKRAILRGRRRYYAALKKHPRLLVSSQAERALYMAIFLGPEYRLLGMPKIADLMGLNDDE